ncbi:MAG TPA: helix-turn-helix domain-containing protein [Gammaproteobacteria bacterium]
MFVYGVISVAWLLRLTTILKSYSTARVPRGARVAYWNDLHWSLFSPLEVRPLNRGDFTAAFQVDRLGPLSIAKTVSASATIERTDSHVAQTPERRVCLVLPVRGEAASIHYGREALLREGDFTLYDSHAPGWMRIDDANEALLVVIPYGVLAQYVPAPECVCGLPVSGAHGFGHTVAALLRSLWAQIECGFPAQFGEDVARSLLELIATCYAMQHTDAARSSVAAARRGQIKRYLENRLRDPELNAVAVARALGLTPRYVRMVFAAEGESISAYLLRRRLEECARQLSSSLWQGRSITETAFDWGFTNMAHFTRAFKEHFGTTPTAYRRARLEQTGHAGGSGGRRRQAAQRARES